MVIFVPDSKPNDMKKVILFLIVVASGFSAIAQDKEANEADIAQIKKTIQTAYVEGLQNEGDTVKINMGFH